MDEMSTSLGGLIGFVLAMLALSALVLFCAAVWLGQRRVRRGQWRRAFWLTNGLVALNGWWAVMMLLGDSRFEEDPWQWLLAGVGGPMLLGYALGTSWGLLRGPKPASGA